MFFSCNSLPKLEIITFTDTKEIKGEKIILDDNPDFITINGGRIITFDPDSKENFISIYDDTTYCKIKKLATYGRGENEFIMINYMGYTSVNPKTEETSFLILDYLKNKYHMINIDKSIKNGGTVIDYSIDSEKDNLIVNNGIVNDTLAVCISNDSRYLYLYNYIKKIPENKLLINDEIIDQENNRNLSYAAFYNINRNRYFIYYFIVNRVISCDKYGGNKKDYAVNKELISYENNDISSMNYYYFWADYNNDYIFVLCPNRSLNNYDNNNSLYIDVYDWYSNPIIRLKVNEPLYSISLDKDKNIIYGITNTGVIYKYIIPIGIKMENKLLL